MPLSMYVCSHSRYAARPARLSQLSLDRSRRRAGRYVGPGGHRIARSIPKAAISRSMRGLNDRNLCPRPTPCDQDFLRRLARDTEPESLEESYSATSSPCTRNSGVRRDRPVHHRRTYLFVPNNPRYKGSQRCSSTAQPSRQQKQEQEMTKASGLAAAGDAATSGAALALRRGWRAIRGGRRDGCCGEGIGSDSLWPLLNAFLDTVGSSVMEGAARRPRLRHGPEIGPLKRDHAHRHVIPIRSDIESARRRSRLDELPRPRRNTSQGIVHRCRIPNPSVDRSHPTPRRRSGNRCGSRR